MFLLVSISCDSGGVDLVIDDDPPEFRDPDLEKINLPPGFQIDIYAANVPGARSLALTEDGVLFVGTRGNKVYAVVDADQDAEADTVIGFVEGLRVPNGVAVRNGDLYVAEIDRILRYDDVGSSLSNPPTPVTVFDALPSETHHGWKYIAFGPDGKLYVPIGAPCNICDAGSPFSAIWRMNADGSEFELFASGVRNSVGFDWHPTNGDLWFSDNQRDHLGDDVPNDELNHAPVPGLHFGYPYFHAGDVRDPELGDGRNEEAYTHPAQKLGPHVAPLGIEFYTDRTFPVEYQNQLFIAEHGSWNRSEKIGYRVSLIRLDNDGNVLSYEVFADGWLQGQNNWGRPVDLEQMPDGSLLLSDDYKGVIYRISYAD